VPNKIRTLNLSAGIRQITLPPRTLQKAVAPNAPRLRTRHIRSICNRHTRRGVVQAIHCALLDTVGHGILQNDTEIHNSVGSGTGDGGDADGPINVTELAKYEAAGAGSGGVIGVI
jgi:hypothetical protein